MGEAGRGLNVNTEVLPLHVEFCWETLLARLAQARLPDPAFPEGFW